MKILTLRVDPLYLWLKKNVFQPYTCFRETMKTDSNKITIKQLEANLNDTLESILEQYNSDCLASGHTNTMENARTFLDDYHLRDSELLMILYHLQNLEKGRN